MTDTNWWMIHENVCTLLDHLVDTGHSAHDVAAAHEKPWKYEDEYREAVAVLEADNPTVRTVTIVPPSTFDQIEASLDDPAEPNETLVRSARSLRDLDLDDA